MNRLIPVAAALLAGGLGTLSFFHDIELDTYDRRVAVTARPAAPADRISVVFIDNDSLRRMEPLVGRWPWPRLVHATVIDYLAAAGAKVIAYDVLFAERDLGKFMVANTEWTGDESDAALVDSSRRAGNVIHAAEAASIELVDPSRALTENLEAPALNVRLSQGGCVERRPRVTPPFQALAQASRGIGHTLLTLDSDGPVRRIAPMVQIGERTIPSFSMATVMATGEAPVMRVEPGPDGQCSALIPWRGPAYSSGGMPTFNSYSFYDLFYSQQQLIEGQ